MLLLIILLPIYLLIGVSVLSLRGHRAMRKWQLLSIAAFPLHWLAVTFGPPLWKWLNEKEDSIL
jgi:hypothetical protein